MSDSVRPHRRQPTRLPHPWGSPGKNTGVGCHFLLQCMKVKRESEVAQSCPTLLDPMERSPPGSPCPWDFPGKSTGVGRHCLLQLRHDFLHVSSTVSIYKCAWVCVYKSCRVNSLPQRKHLSTCKLCIFNVWKHYLVLPFSNILGFPVDSDGEESTHNERDLGLIPGLGRSPGEGNGYPLQYFCLENSMDRGAW